MYQQRAVTYAIIAVLIFLMSVGAFEARRFDKLITPFQPVSTVLEDFGVVIAVSVSVLLVQLLTYACCSADAPA